MRKQRENTGAALAASVFLALLFGIAVYKTMGFVYTIADDIIMRDIASGAFTGTPDGHLIFVRYVLGFLLSCCYRLVQTVDWYGFLMAGVVFLALAAVLYRGFSEDRSLRWKAVYAGTAMGVFGCAMIFHAAQFEWTVSAAAAGASALYLYATAREESRGKQTAEGIFIWLLLFLTYFIRENVFMMVLPGFGITFLWKFVHRKEKSFCFDFKKLILPAAVFGSLALAAVAEHQAYQGEGWREFQAFQSARADVYDYYGVPSYEAAPEIFDAMGVDALDMRCLRHYALYLVDGMDAELMEKIDAESQRQSGRQAGLKTRIKNGILLAAEQASDSEYFTASIPMLVFLAGALFLSIRRQKKALLPLLLFLAEEGALWLYLGFGGRLPERVAFSMHLITLAGTAASFYRLWLQEEKEKEPGTGRNAVVLALLVCFLAAAAFQWQSSAASNQEKLAADESYQLFKQKCRENPENLYFIETFTAEPVGGARVSTYSPPGINNCLTLGDWYSTSPLDEERFEALGIKNVEQTILENPNAYLVVKDAEDPGFLADYFETRYSGCTLVSAGVEAVGGRNYFLYQISRN